MTDYECEAAEKFIARYLERDLAVDGTKTATQLMLAAYEECARVRDSEMADMVYRMQTVLKDLRWARLNGNNETTPIIRKLEYELSRYPQYLVEF